ncbi:MAG: 4-hydroxy-tetrahydrodipicolinate synthase [Oligoflexales bacterium]
MSSITGVYTAIATPFLPNSEIDWEGFEKLVGLQKEAKIDGLVVCGTTGESPALSVQEKLSLIRKAKVLANGQMKIMGGTGGNNTQQSVELSRLAVDAGADSLLIVTPPYNKPSLAGMIGHFSAIAKEVRVPLCLYHVPGRTGQHLTVEELREVCALPSVTSVKEASGNLAFYSRGIEATKASFLSGDDITFLPSLSVGGSGVVSVISNLFPKAWKRLYTSYQQKDLKDALAIHNATLELNQHLYCESNPGPLKAALSVAGICKNEVRLPLAPVRSENFEKVRATYQATVKNLKALGINE